MEKVDFDLGGKELTVRNVFIISPQNTKFKIVDKDCKELWWGTELNINKCKYKNNEVFFMRVIGEPDGYIHYIELRIEV